MIASLMPGSWVLKRHTEPLKLESWTSNSSSRTVLRILYTTYLSREPRRYRGERNRPPFRERCYQHQNRTAGNKKERKIIIMWFSQLFLKVDNGVGIELYKEDNSGKGLFLGEVRRANRVPDAIWNSKVYRIFPVDGRTMCAFIEECADD